jgi:hypothetical protein
MVIIIIIIIIITADRCSVIGFKFASLYLQIGFPQRITELNVRPSVPTVIRGTSNENRYCADTTM